MQELIEAAKAVCDDAQPNRYLLVTREACIKGSLITALRSALSNAETHLPALKAAGGWRPIETAPKETSLGELRQWCEARAIECGTKAEDRTIAERLRLGWAMSADALACVIEKIDDMNPANASDGSLALGAVPEGGEERNSSSVERAEASPCGATEAQHSAGWAEHELEIYLSLKLGFMEGFDRSGEGWNGEHPATDKVSAWLDVQASNWAGSVVSGDRLQEAINADERRKFEALMATYESGGEPERGDRYAPTPAESGALGPSEASAGNSGLDEPLPPALPYSAASRP